jgi:hypothetical protein
MPSQDDLDNFKRLQDSQGQTAMPPFPQLPEDVMVRFPSMREWNDEVQRWASESLGIKIQGGV